MGWEHYLSAETIYNTSSEELEQIKEELQHAMNTQHMRFVDYKKWLLDEFESVFTWYKNHYSKQIWLEALEKEFNLKLENSDSTLELVKVIEQITRNADIPIKLRDMLKSKYSRLCLSGKLPRDFIIQVRPLIILETQQACLSFLDKISSVFARAKTQQLEVFETLIRKLSIAENEEEACQFIQESIRVVKSFLDLKSTFTLFDQISNKHLYSIVSTLQVDLKRKDILTLLTSLILISHR